MPHTSLKTSPADFTLYPLVWLALCFALGILIGDLTEWPWPVILAAVLAAMVPAALFSRRKWAVIFVALAFVLAGAFCRQIEEDSVGADRLKRIFDENRILSGEPIEVEGVLSREPELAVGGFFLEIRAERLFFRGAEQSVSGTVRYFAPAGEAVAREYEQLDLRYGARLRIAGRLRREDGYLNPGVRPRREILDQQRIDAVGVIRSPLLVEKVTGGAESFQPLGWLYRRRQELVRVFHEKFNKSTAGVLIASLLGDRYFLDRPTAELFREGGTFHVLVISGLHITFIGGLTLLFVRSFTRRRLWQFLLAAAFLWAYSIAVGAESPVVRAALMFTILLFAQVIYRPGTLLNALGFCVLILLACRPGELFSLSLQLTAVSVTAIVACAFPMLERLRAVGEWRLSAATPFPPTVPLWLKRFCETLYWRESVWQIESRRQIWSARLFKSPYLRSLEARNLQSLLRWLFEGVTVSLAVQLWLLPLLVVYFHRISPASVFLNLWVGFFIALESFAAVFAVGLRPVSETLALPLIRLAEMLNWLLLLAPQILTTHDLASVRVPVYSGAMRAVYGLYFLPVLLLTALLHRWDPFALRAEQPAQISDVKFQISRKMLRSGAAVLESRLASPRLILALCCGLFILLFCLIVFHPASAPAADGRLRIDFLDVGQGDAALITFPNGETLLIDGGGKINFRRSSVEREGDEPERFEPDTRSVGEAVVSEVLWEKGYSEIDYLLATHAHTDHLQGLIDVAKNFRVKAALFGRPAEENAEFEELSRVLRERGVEIIRLGRGDVLGIGGVTAEVLYPAIDGAVTGLSENDRSLVLRLSFGVKKFLLTGDIETEAERELLQNPALLKADLVKVAHHGSRTSSTPAFVAATEAEYAVIPVGRNSPFGHPHEEVVERWKNAGAKVATTGDCGMISVSTDGKDWRLEAFNKLIFR